ncbi:alpha/beta hydrolase family protein [Streptosporangium jomthongense]|uniref:Alpha/beta hydrolase family protein n=1 Tax=Streptosporangium jomthongense TaxID=1193683 RepID=A0ABV8ETV6_9ACTN
MRPLELVALATTTLSFLTLALPRLRGMRPVNHVPPVALLAAVAQVVVEGARWQLFPAYALALSFFLVWLWGRRLRGLLGVSPGVLGLLVALPPPVVLPVFTFPEPTGPYGVGTVTYHWTDTSRQETFSADPAARRELMTQVWYPAARSSGGGRAAYAEGVEALAPALARMIDLPSFTFDHLRYVTTNARESVPVSAGVHPVLVFLEGFNGFRQMNTFQVEELVSHGYVVVAVDHPYIAASVTFPDGRHVTGFRKNELNALVQQSVSPARTAPTFQGRSYPEGIVPYLVRDVSFVLDRLTALNASDPERLLTGKLDMRRVGAFGVSLGGIVAGEACRTETRLGACLVMDAPMPDDVVSPGLGRPVLWITRDARTMRQEKWNKVDIVQHQTSMRTAFGNLKGDGYFVQVPDMFHVNLTDVPSWSPLFPYLGVTGPADPGRVHEIVNAYSTAFFDRHLRGSREPLLDGPSNRYPEVVLHRRRP